MLRMSDSTELFIDTEAEREKYLQERSSNNRPQQLDAYTSCLYFIRNHWTNMQYKAFRRDSNEMQVLLVPLEEMKIALESMFCIPKLFRCQSIDSCKKCGILSIPEVLKFELTLDDVRERLFFSKGNDPRNSG